MDTSKIPVVSVIISVYNGERTIRKCLDSLLAQSYQDFEVIVVDDASTDNTRKILMEYVPRIHFFAFPFNVNVGQARCRNQAAKHAQGKYLVFIDADCIADKDWLQELLNAHFICVGGAQKLPFDASFKQRMIFAFMKRIGFITEYAGNNMRGVEHIPSCNAFYRKDIFDKLGGFRDLRYGEDVDFNYRLHKDGWGLY